MQLAIVLMLAGTLVAPQAVHAHAIPTQFWGQDAEHLSSWRAITSGDIVQFWQSMLFVDGALACSGGIDGWFGGGTANATSTWQTWEGIGVDGEVFHETWGRARSYAFWSQAAGAWFYDGWNADVAWNPYSLGVWFVSKVNGAWQTTDHPEITGAAC